MSEFGRRELPDGRTVCEPHALVRCGKCATDFSLLNEGKAEDGDSGPAAGNWRMTWALHHIGPEFTEIRVTRGIAMIPMPRPPYETLIVGHGIARGTGRDFPTKFVPPSVQVTPLDLFSDRVTHGSMIR